jgi:NAD(P)-dependent dehydrogenase (short-subunit alcohol dehydrogenase family)
MRNGALRHCHRKWPQDAGQGAAGAFVDSDWAKLAGHMKTRGSGSIVNPSAAVATRPTPWFAAYAASKAFH